MFNRRNKFQANIHNVHFTKDNFELNRSHKYAVKMSQLNKCTNYIYKNALQMN